VAAGAIVKSHAEPRAFANDEGHGDRDPIDQTNPHRRRAGPSGSSAHSVASTAAV